MVVQANVADRDIVDYANHAAGVETDAAAVGE